MSDTGLEVFDTTIHKTHVWLNDIKRQLDVDDTHAAYRALRIVLHTLRDRLTVDEAVKLGAQLPMLVRGMYFEGWRPAGKPDKSIDRDELLGRIADAFTNHGFNNPHHIVQAVLHTIDLHLSSGETDKIWSCLPKSMRELWPEPVG
ncbi:MAG: DUF2267 domain-containing protein [Phycisphaerales bacterium]